MEVIMYRGRLIQLDVLGDIANDELVLECWDLAPDGGRLFTLVRDDEGVLHLRPHGREVPLDLLEQVAAIAGTELGEQ